MDDRFENLPDWQQRFLLEYEELADRAEKLHAILTKYDAGVLDFTPQTPIGLLRAQLSVMCAYMEILEELLRNKGNDRQLREEQCQQQTVTTGSR